MRRQPFCRECGNVQQRSAPRTGRPSLTCDVCRTKVRAEATCETCGKRYSYDFPPGRNAPRRFCSAHCCYTRQQPSKADPTIPNSSTCETCGKVLQRHPHSKLRRWCDERCKERFRAATKNGTRRALYRETDLTSEWEQAQRHAAIGSPCPLCDVVMIAEPYRPASVELDHIHPIIHGGMHTRDNVRFICRACNSERGARARSRGVETSIEELLV